MEDILYEVRVCSDGHLMCTQITTKLCRVIYHVGEAPTNCYGSPRDKDVTSGGIASGREGFKRGALNRN